MTHSINLFESNLNTDTCFKNITGKAFGAAVLEYFGASKTVFERTSMTCYVNSLGTTEKLCMFLNLEMGET